jgi:hypothetical protein
MPENPRLLFEQTSFISIKDDTNVKFSKHFVQNLKHESEQGKETQPSQACFEIAHDWAYCLLK